MRFGPNPNGPTHALVLAVLAVVGAVWFVQCRGGYDATDGNDHDHGHDHDHGTGGS